MEETETTIDQIKLEHSRVNGKRHEKQETNKDNLCQQVEKYNQKKREQEKINALHKRQEYACNGGYLGNNKDKLWDWYEYKEKIPQMLNEAEQHLKRLYDEEKRRYDEEKRLYDEKIDALLQENA